MEVADAVTAAKTGDRGASLAQRLEQLCAAGGTGGRPISNEQLAEVLRQRGGPTVSATYLYLLRTGQRDNPTRRHLQALADYFGVPVGYFFEGGDDELEREWAAAAATARQDPAVAALAMRAYGLSAESLDAVGDLVGELRRLEGLT